MLLFFNVQIIDVWLESLNNKFRLIGRKQLGNQTEQLFRGKANVL